MSQNVSIKIKVRRSKIEGSRIKDQEEEYKLSIDEINVISGIGTNNTTHLRRIQLKYSHTSFIDFIFTSINPNLNSRKGGRQKMFCKIYNMMS